MSNLKPYENRLRSLIISDKRENHNRIERVLKAELVNVIRNYFDVCMDDIDLSILIRDDGCYDMQLNAVSRSIKFANSFDNQS